MVVLIDILVEKLEVSFAGHFEGIYDNAKQLSFPGTNALHRQKDALIQRCTVGDVFDHMQWFSTKTRP